MRKPDPAAVVLDGLGKAQCCLCEEVKDKSEFYTSSQPSRWNGIDNRCKPCHNKASTARRRSREMDWTIEDYDIVFAEQDGKCAICRKSGNLPYLKDGKVPAISRSLSADHNHKTGKRRGILCADCNRGIAKFHDSPALLKAAADYIETYSN